MSREYHTSLRVCFACPQRPRRVARSGICARPDAMQVANARIGLLLADCPARKSNDALNLSQLIAGHWRSQSHEQARTVRHRR